MARRKYSPEVKAAVMASLLSGQGTNELAKQYKLPIGTVRAWKSELVGSRSEGPLPTESRREVGQLLLTYLRANLETLHQQQVVFRDAEWLKKQDASDAAVLHGVLTDKAIRLLEALGNSDGGEQQPQ